MVCDKPSFRATKARAFGSMFSQTNDIVERKKTQFMRNTYAESRRRLRRLSFEAVI